MDVACCSTWRTVDPDSHHRVEGSMCWRLGTSAPIWPAILVMSLKRRALTFVPLVVGSHWGGG